VTEDTVWDTEKGELRILGQRHTAIDAQTLCNFLDSLVGIQVSEVIMHNLEFRLGKLDAARLRAEKGQVSVTELIEDFVRTDRLSGIGITKVTMSENPQNSIHIEVTNPSVKGSTGAAKSFIFAWWAGVLTSLFDKEFDVNGAAYSEEKNMIVCQMVSR
jgi:hypothetical protein